MSPSCLQTPGTTDFVSGQEEEKYYSRIIKNTLQNTALFRETDYFVSIRALLLLCCIVASDNIEKASHVKAAYTTRKPQVGLWGNLYFYTRNQRDKTGMYAVESLGIFSDCKLCYYHRPLNGRAQME